MHSTEARARHIGSTKHISANAYRPSDAIAAVKREVNNQGFNARGYTVERAAEQKPDAKVAVIVLNTGGTDWRPSRERCTTYIVSFTITGVRS